MNLYIWRCMSYYINVPVSTHMRTYSQICLSDKVQVTNYIITSTSLGSEMTITRKLPIQNAKDDPKYFLQFLSMKLVKSVKQQCKNSCFICMVHNGLYSIILCWRRHTVRLQRVCKRNGLANIWQHVTKSDTVLLRWCKTEIIFSKQYLKYLLKIMIGLW